MTFKTRVAGSLVVIVAFGAVSSPQSHASAPAPSPPRASEGKAKAPGTVPRTGPAKQRGRRGAPGTLPRR
ncbi:hypothetical protein OJ997_04175 [Solirubrobacter phytolaccae]|uniref:Uncharacterized protein n=1 Tax=Solirubrobacter phytolaccae TaxID=1404360 RepID=A0A9X3N721_9ACTN|nr:hypothetical protein [Solirubrobacter phytolaccae]MDA0179482.1 hypothetical protein [Solirubrobacter phytolaccae]